MTVESTIDYEGLAQEAMRGVVSKVLAQTAKMGLAGDHHFYISFDTEAPGATLSKRLKEKYPREMTIVLQHRFWDLIVTEDRFEVKLTFDGIPERLVVPFASIRVFFDPSVRFGLQFEDPNADPETRTGEPGNSFDSLTPRAGATRTGRKQTRRKPQVVDHAGDNAAASGSTPSEGAAEPAQKAPRTPLAANSPGAKRSPAAADEPANADGAEPPKPAGAEIVSLDKFRKK